MSGQSNAFVQDFRCNLTLSSDTWLLRLCRCQVLQYGLLESLVWIANHMVRSQRRGLAKSGSGGSLSDLHSTGRKIFFGDHNVILPRCDLFWMFLDSRIIDTIASGFSKIDVLVLHYQSAFGDFFDSITDMLGVDALCIGFLGGPTTKHLVVGLQSSQMNQLYNQHSIDLVVLSCSQTRWKVLTSSRVN